jgi:hypothetical protein
VVPRGSIVSMARQTVQPQEGGPQDGQDVDCWADAAEWLVAPLLPLHADQPEARELDRRLLEHLRVLNAVPR